MSSPRYPFPPSGAGDWDEAGCTYLGPLDADALRVDLFHTRHGSLRFVTKGDYANYSWCWSFSPGEIRHYARNPTGLLLRHLEACARVACARAKVRGLVRDE